MPKKTDSLPPVPACDPPAGQREHCFTGDLVYPPQPVRWFPPELRKGCFDCNLVGAEAAGKYGVFQMRVLKRFMIQSTVVDPGDVIEVAGNAAWEMRQLDRAEFLDTRQGREEALLTEARRLKIPLTDEQNPAFDEAKMKRAGVGRWAKR